MVDKNVNKEYYIHVLKLKSIKNYSRRNESPRAYVSVAFFMLKSHIKFLIKKGETKNAEGKENFRLSQGKETE